MQHEDLYQYATDRQREYLNAITEFGTQAMAAASLKISLRTLEMGMQRLRERAAKQERTAHLDPDSTPAGYMIKGTSTLYDKEGNVKLQWNKTQVDTEAQFALMKTAIEEINKEVTPVEPRPVLGMFATDVQKERLAFYPVGDFHLGMLSWAKETGGDWDMGIAEEMMSGAIRHLVGSLPVAKTGLIALLGDFFHYDSMVPETPKNRNALDSDTRPQKMVRAGIRIARMMVERCLDRHDEVHVIVEIGNHDLFGSVWLMEALKALYDNEPRVIINDSPAKFHYHRFGKTLIGVTHGDTTKMNQLPLVMATDRPQDWGETEFRYWHTGHVHHSKTQLAVIANQDFVGCSAESHRILAPEDAYAANAGYRSVRDMKAILIHDRHGEVTRTTFNPRMMEEL